MCLHVYLYEFYVNCAHVCTCLPVFSWVFFLGVCATCFFPFQSNSVRLKIKEPQEVFMDQSECF